MVGTAGLGAMEEETHQLCWPGWVGGGGGCNGEGGRVDGVNGVPKARRKRIRWED
jgi:hypothetical protein